MEGARLSQVSGAAVGAGTFDLVGAPALLAVSAVDEGVGERGHMSRRHPDLGVGEDRGVHADDVVTLLDHRAPPRVLDVAQHVGAEGAVVVSGADTAVDLGRRENEPAPLAQVDHRLEQLWPRCGGLTLVIHAQRIVVARWVSCCGVGSARRVAAPWCGAIHAGPGHLGAGHQTVLAPGDAGEGAIGSLHGPAMFAGGCIAPNRPGQPPLPTTGKCA